MGASSDLVGEKWVTFFISFLYAMSDKYHQSLTGFRDGRWSDVVIYSIGMIIALITYSLVPIRYREKATKGVG
ncbi:VanZ family protein [Tepidibacillus infernus]|uniref:VanZ-like domain-containing protein n=1 Tax=Tepidibacillus decaturensis TaxID=1413211 RepID=A0A135L6E8_9BACI|nr:VanZ family protein [Tepidibacillus decaturensis]KXG44552.1 hypothetical protein U473_11385 [Tepidibacillus decaturensis]